MHSYERSIRCAFMAFMKGVSMRKYLGALAVIAACLLVPASAFGHHIDNNRSKAVCVLVNNVPTLQVDVLFVDFEQYNKPVYWTISLNGVAVDNGSESWPAEENPHWQHWTRQVTANTSYSIIYDAHWGRGFNQRIPFETVICPQPVPPPVVTDCKGLVVPPGGTPSTCPPPVTPPPTTPPPTTTPPPPPPPAPCVLTRTPRTKVHAGMRNVIRVVTTPGTVVTLKLPRRKKAIFGTADAQGVVRFVVRPRHSGTAVITAGAECGQVRVKVRKKHKTVAHRPPRTVG